MCETCFTSVEPCEAKRIRAAYPVRRVPPLTKAEGYDVHTDGETVSFESVAVD